MNDLVTILHGDCLDVLKTLPSDSVDSVVTDPPAGISFMGKEWDRHKGGRDQWVAWFAERLAECLRVAKPGAHALVWALPRTSHWTAMAIEDAGWVIEDRVAHIFGTGFPKHKSKLKPAVEDWWLATKPGGKKWLGVDACRIEGHSYTQEEWNKKGSSGNNGPVSWGQISKGKQKAYAEGLIKIPTGRWPTNLVLSHHPECKPNGTKKVKGSGYGVVGTGSGELVSTACYGSGRKSLICSCHVDADGMEVVEVFDCHPDCPVRLIDEQSGELKTGGSPESKILSRPFESVAKGKEPECIISSPHFGSSGGASRFFPGFLYCPKANRKDRGEGNTHPTVKAEPLMRWLCKLVTPPGGTVLDPFAGSGSTGFAAEAEGFKLVLIEQDITYVEIIKNRLASIKAKTPLFG